MSSSNNVPNSFLTTFELRSGTDLPSNEYNWNIPPEFMYCFNLDDDVVMTEVMEESTPGLVDIVDMEWIPYTGPQNSTTNNTSLEPPIRRLMDINYYKVHRTMPKAIEIDPTVSVEKAVRTVQKGKKGSSTAKARGPYNSYLPHKIQELIDLVFLCGYFARKAGLELGFAVRTAQHYCRQYRLDEDKVLPRKKPGNYSYRIVTQTNSFFVTDFKKNK